MGSQKPFLKLLLPVLLGVAAFAGNRYYLKGQRTAKSYVSVKTKLAADGQRTFTRDDLEEIEVFVTEGRDLRAVPWKQSPLLFGAPVRRDFQPGDLVLLSDMGPEKVDLGLQVGETALVVPLPDISVEPELLKVGRYVGFVTRSNTQEVFDGDEFAPPELFELGPFRIVSVGAMIKQETATTDAPAVERASTISVATRVATGGALSTDAAKLVEASEEDAILSLTLYRFDQRPGETQPLQPQDIEQTPEPSAPDDIIDLTGDLSSERPTPNMLGD